MVRRPAATLLVVAGLLAPSIVRAQPGAPPSDPPPGDASRPREKEAEQHFKRARQLYEEGDFALALVEFKRAYEIAPNYRVLYNIGQVNIQLFNYAAARLALERYLHDGGAEITPARRSQVETDLAMLRERTAYLQVVATPAADVAIDDVPVGKAPFEEPLLVNAGQRKIVVTRAGYAPVTRVMVLAGGDRTDVKFELVPLPSSEGKSVIVLPPSTPQRNYTPAVIAWIATGTLAIAGGITGGLYLSKESEIEELSKPANRVSRQDALDASASATRLAVAADVLGVAALAAGLVATYFTLRPPTTDAHPRAVGLRVRPAGGGVAVPF